MMPSTPPRMCSVPGCPGLSKGGMCDACKAKHGTDSENRGTRHRAKETKWRNSARWRGKNGRRKRQLLREPLCRSCATKGKVVVGTDADHILPAMGDYRRFWFGELQTLCPSCHREKTALEKHG